MPDNETYSEGIIPMKSFSVQSGWRNLPCVLAVGLLLAVAGCGGDDSPGVTPASAPPGPDQTSANGIWTGTVGGVNVVALTAGGEMYAFSDTTSGQDRVLYRALYTVGAEGALTAGADAVITHDYATGMAIPDVGAFAATLATETMGMGDAAVETTTIEGAFGEGANEVAIMLTRLSGTNMNAHDGSEVGDDDPQPPHTIDELEGIWVDSNLWTSDADVGGGATTLTIDHTVDMDMNHKLTMTGAVAGAGCMLRVTKQEPKTEADLKPKSKLHAYGTDASSEVTIESCTDTDLNGDYSATVFLANSNDAVGTGTKDRLYLVALNQAYQVAVAEGRSAADTPDPVFRVVIADRQ